MKITPRFLWLILLGLCLASAVRADALNSCAITTSQTTLDGGVMHYRQAGAGPHVLLLHGVFANKEQWDSVLCLLAAGGYTAIAPDLPGYGQSVDFPVTDYKLENQVARVREFLERLGVTRFDIAGNSMGGAIAALYARQYPEQAYTLAFIGGPLGITDWSEPFKEAVYQGVNPLIPVTVAEFDLELSLLLVNPPTLPEETKQAAIKDYVERNRHYQQIWTIVSLYDRVLEPPRFWIRTPALILWGEQDRIFPVDGAATLRQRFPHGKLVKLPNAGHLLHLENPAEIATIYLDFLRTYSRIHARGR